MRDSLRVLQIVSASHPGGTERIVSSLSQGLISNGCAVQVVCPERGWLTESLKNSGATVATKAMRGVMRYGAIASLSVQLKERPVDIIHAHLHRAARAAFVINRLTGIPVVTTVHSAKPNPIYRRLATGSNRILAVSDYVRTLLLDWGVAASHIDVVHNGTDFDQQPKANRSEVLDELAIPRDRKIVGFVGRVQPAKGCFELIDCIRLLRDEGRDVQLILVGNVEAMDARGYASSKGVADRVSFTGPRFDVSRLIDAFDVLALPSHRETFGVAALEAMARGKPVVATRVGGLPEVVLDGETGILVEPTPDALGVAIGRLLDNPDEAEEFGARGLEIARSKFSLDSMIGRHEQVYASILSRRAVLAGRQEATAR